VTIVALVSLVWSGFDGCLHWLTGALKEIWGIKRTAGLEAARTGIIIGARPGWGPFLFLASFARRP